MSWAWLWALLGCAPQGERLEHPRSDRLTEPALVEPVQDCVHGVECAGSVCWVQICGGSYWMGGRPELATPKESPQIEVTVPSFEIMEAEITVGQFDLCVLDGGCASVEDEAGPDSDGLCLQDDPAQARGCLAWLDASDYCAWVGGRLPSEAEWEYAARSEGRDVLYPWGDEPPTCDRARLGCQAQCDEFSAPGPTCDFASGRTEQGVCDLGGNAIEWVQDWFVSGYETYPTDGSPSLIPGPWRSMRGGGLGSCAGPGVWTRTFHPPDFRYAASGARCVR
jgi:formylglycine-generating enzyme